jgi:hypothetical protein
VTSAATPAQERIHALPIWLLVLGALAAGSGAWCFVALPPNPAGGGLLLATAAILLGAAVVALRAAAVADAREAGA